MDMFVLLLLVWLHLLQRVDGAPQSFQPKSDLRVCVGDPVTFTCTVVDDVPLSEATVWTATGEVECSIALAHSVSLTDTCSDTTPGSSTVFMVNGSVQGMDCVQSEFTAAMATANMDNTLIECRNGSALNPSTLVGSSRLFVERDPPSAPGDVRFTVDVSDLRQGFVVQWSGATVGNGADIRGYNVDISGPDDGCGVRGVPQFTAGEEYQCPMPSIGGTYAFHVSTVCGTLDSRSAIGDSITLRVPEAPTLTACPVYDQSTGELLRIESICTTVPAVTIAYGVNVPTDAYIFSYNGVSQSVPSGRCTGGTCTDVFTSTDPTVSQYTISVTARNVVGEGPSATRVINAINDLLEVIPIINTMDVVCRFLSGFPSTDRECRIEYSTQEGLSGSVVDTGSNTSGDTITVALTARLDENTAYYYRVTATATAEGVCVRVEDFFQTGQGSGLSLVVGIAIALTFLVAFTAGLIVAFVIAYCYIRRKILKGQYSPSDSQIPTPTQASAHVQEGGIELKENISYGPIPSQPPAPQQCGPMYEEVVQTGNIEVKANAAYGPVGH